MRKLFLPREVQLSNRIREREEVLTEYIHLICLDRLGVRVPNRDSGFDLRGAEPRSVDNVPPNVVVRN